MNRIIGTTISLVSLMALLQGASSFLLHWHLKCDIILSRRGKNCLWLQLQICIQCTRAEIFINVLMHLNWMIGELKNIFCIFGRSFRDSRACIYGLRHRSGSKKTLAIQFLRRQDIFIWWKRLLLSLLCQRFRCKHW